MTRPVAASSDTVNSAQIHTFRLDHTPNRTCSADGTYGRWWERAMWFVSKPDKYNLDPNRTCATAFHIQFDEFRLSKMRKYPLNGRTEQTNALSMCSSDCCVTCAPIAVATTLPIQFTLKIWKCEPHSIDGFWKQNARAIVNSAHTHTHRVFTHSLNLIVQPISRCYQI